ncbi:MAG: hypothetical protein WKH64_02365 [Chloroflexia bacterium]
MPGYRVDALTDAAIRYIAANLDAPLPLPLAAGASPPEPPGRLPAARRVSRATQAAGLHPIWRRSAAQRSSTSAATTAWSKRMEEGARCWTRSRVSTSWRTL